jgi:hypothetical protein
MPHVPLDKVIKSSLRKLEACDGAHVISFLTALRYWIATRSFWVFTDGH